jgi:uncharacterized RDD family membrane protein YckC
VKARFVDFVNPSDRKAILSNRKPGYLFGIFLLAVFCSAPHLFVLFKLASDAVVMKRWPFQWNTNWGRVVQQGGMMSHTAFVRDRFLYLSYRDRVNGVFQWNLTAFDPRTRTEASLKINVRGATGFQVLTFGSRLWLIAPSEAYEVVGDTARPSTMVIPTPWVAESQRFLLDDEPAVIAKSGLRFAISTFKAGAWVVSDDLLLPDGQRETLVDGIPIHFAKAVTATCLNQGDRIHLFLEIDSRMLYRQGLDLQAATGSQTRTVGLPDEPASALNAIKTTDDASAWTVINKAPIPDFGPNVPLRYVGNGNKFGILVSGHPAALIVDRSDPGAMVGHLFRFEGRQWVEFATQTFPFGTVAIRTVVSQDGLSSLIVATTSTGAAHVYEVDASSVRLMSGNQAFTAHSFVAGHWLANAMGVLCVASMLGAFLGFGTTLLMWFDNRPNYGFGTQNVRLAAIERRGVARIIDLGLIAFSTAALAWWLTRHLDWLSLAEAMNLQLPHPAVQSATRTAWTLIVWLMTCQALLVIGQARWGLTIGKWCCGLRTQQSTLRPCGIARSLVRELVFWVDVCGLLCWTPGIVSMALTERRQRLGDLVADTLVVEAASLQRNVSHRVSSEQNMAADHLVTGLT